MIDIEINIKDIGIIDINTKDTEEFGIPLVFNISDITNLSTRRSSFSKTIKVIGSKNNNEIFNQLYDINGVNFNFNINRKYDCSLLVNKNVVLDGFVVLNKIYKTLINSKYEIVYEINIFDEVKNFFDDIDKKKLIDLDFSTPFTFMGQTYNIGDHEHTSQIIGDRINSNPTYLDGYDYPLIDFGYYINGDYPHTSVSKALMYPSVFFKYILDKIFYDVGYTYSSDFLNGISYDNIFKHYVTMYNKSNEINNVELCKYNTDGGLQIGDDGVTIVREYIPLGRNICEYDNNDINYYELYNYLGSGRTDAAEYNGDEIEVNGPRADEDGQYKLVFSIDVADDNSGTEYCVRPANDANINIGKYNSENNEYIFNFMVINSTEMRNGGSGTYRNYIYKNTYELEDDLSKGDFFFLSGGNGTRTELDGDGICVHIDTKFLINGISLELINIKNVAPQYTGTTQDIKLHDILPDMTQSQFIKNLIKMNNLFIWTNYIDNKNLYIEPRNDFYRKGHVINWTDKIDYSKEIKIYHPSIKGNIVFDYSKGLDHYSNGYYDSYGETYGTKDIKIDNDYLSGIENIKLDYQSYNLRRKGNNLIYPILYDKNNSKQTWFDDKISTKPLVGLISNYEIEAMDFDLKLSHYDNGNYENDYLERISFVSHIKKRGGISYDINFETNNEMFDFGLFDKNSNLYIIYWENHIKNLIDDDSRIVEYNINLNIEDIINLDFKNRIVLDGQLYYLQRVDYDPSNYLSSKVILIKELYPIDLGDFDSNYILKNDSNDYINIDDNYSKIKIK